MPIQSPTQLLIYKLQAIQDAENQASEALERLMSDVENPELKELLDRRREQGKEVLTAVEAGLEDLGDGKGKAQRNEAARGLITEMEMLMGEVQSPEMKQAVMIAGLQSLEHYCVAAWGAVRALAEEIEAEDLMQSMQDALDEGYNWDTGMTELAEGDVNPTAIAGRGHGPPPAHARGQDALRLAQAPPEPVFGIIEAVLGLRQFLPRGLENVNGVWTLVAMAWNMKRMFALKAA